VITAIPHDDDAPPTDDLVPEVAAIIEDLTGSGRGAAHHAARDVLRPVSRWMTAQTDVIDTIAHDLHGHHGVGEVAAQRAARAAVADMSLEILAVVGLSEER
jgi:hypothetical protein